MYSVIKKHRYKNHNDHLALRKEFAGAGNKDVFRMGASDVATIYRMGDKVGLNPYASPTTFFYEACEYTDRYNQQRLETHRGHVQEPVIFKEYWRYWNPNGGTPEEYLENYYGPKIIYRKATKSNCIITNSKYPNLFVSPDYIIEKKGGPLEIKSLSRLTTERYEAGIGPNYVIQAYDQIMVLDTAQGELMNVSDATQPSIYIFNRNETIEKNILDSTNDFVSRVLAGKKIVYSNKTQLQKEQELAMLAPEDNGSMLYTDFLKEKHRPENAKSTQEGTDDQLEIVIKYSKLKEKIKGESVELLMLENKIREFFMDRTIGIIEFVGLGKVSWIEKLTISPNILKNY